MRDDGGLGRVGGGRVGESCPFRDITGFVDELVVGC